MKLLPLLLLAFFTTTSLHAQNFELGLNGGILYNSTPATRDYNYDNNQHRFATGSLKVLYNHHKWQYGCSFDYRSNSYSDNFGLWYPVTTFDISQKQWPIKLFVNRNIVFKHMAIYIGPFLGYTTSKSKITSWNLSESPPSPSHNSWLSAGLQSGATYFVTKHIGINAEVSWECYNYLQGNNAYYSHFGYPITLGIRFRL